MATEPILFQKCQIAKEMTYTLTETKAPEGHGLSKDYLGNQDRF